jgi:mitochondrial fission protein ELM1
MRPLQALLLSDGRPGHYHLAEGVIAALARVRPVAATTLLVGRRRWLPGRLLADLYAAGLPPTMLLSIGYGLAAADLPKADVIVSAGGETLLANAALARATGVPNVFCGSLRRVKPEAFSVIVSSYARHSCLPQHIVALKPSSFDPDLIGRPPDAARRAPGTPPRLAGLLVGGDSGYFRYEPEEWRQLAGFLERSHASHGTRWMVSTSRRTPDMAADRFATLAAVPDGPICDFIDFRTAGPGTLPQLFARIEAVLCTEDSSTMLSEAVCARLPTVGVSPARHGFKEEEREYRDFMRQSGWCRFVPLAELTPERFASELAAIEPLRANHLDSLAAQLRERLPALFA